MDTDFVERLNRTFSGASMADVARRLGIPHATVRNYYKTARLPAPEVLIKIARETGVSLNWLLMGTGEMYGGERPPIGIGRFLEERIGELIDQKFAQHRRPQPKRGALRPEFDIDAAIRTFDDPQRVMSEWFRHEGREYPRDYGVAFFRGWESFTPEDKSAAVRDAKQMIDRVLSASEGE